MKITFIGGGNMGEAMLSAILDRAISAPPDISVSDINEARLQYIKQKYSVAVMSNNRLAIASSDIVILAIKPQNLSDVMTDLNSCLKSTRLVLSIIAGARIDSLRRGLNHACIVRAMPNTPAQIGEGISVWTATTEVTDLQKNWAGSILGAMGKEIYVADEKYLDMATAVSGSGPAYFFLMVEALSDAALDIGLPQNIAGELVLQTMLGSGHLIQKSGRLPAELRRMVTSPGGTTAEALLQFENGGFSKLVLRAVRAAYNRAQKLGG